MAFTLAALGDSYSSGEGGGNYGGTAGACDQSASAWPRLVTTLDPGVTLSAFLACSGAVSADLLNTVYFGQPPQVNALAQVSPPPSLITLTMGGNDVGFSNVLADCYQENCIRDGTLKKEAVTIQDEEPTLRDDYIAVSGADRSATLLVVGYPRIFEQDHYCGVKRLGYGFKPAELAELNALGGELDGVIAQAVAAAAAAGAHVDYVNVTNALQGHEMCTADPWVVQVEADGLWNRADGHPNALGQTAIARIVANYIKNKL
jgi:lysophospholipase L1-like esterase